MEANYFKNISEVEKEIVSEVARCDKQFLRKSADHKAQLSPAGGGGGGNERLGDLCFAICRFSQETFITSSNLTHNLFFCFKLQ